MKAKNCLIFGGTGQIGSNLLRKLAKNNFKVTVVTRNLHQKGNFIKTQANAGYIEIIETNPFDENLIRPLFKKADICINLVGILFEKGKNNFKNIHTNFPSLLAFLCKEYELDQFAHISALGIDASADSKYAASKLEGEKKIKELFPSTTILRPSVVYSVDDNFTTTFMTLLSRLPVFPLYYNGETKFMPIHCSDLTDIIFKVINDEIKSELIECGGPQVLSFKDIVETLMQLIQKKRLLLPLPLFFGNIIAKTMEFLPHPLLTTDQLKLLKYDNIYSNKLKTNSSIGVPSKRIFKEEVNKYCYMWKEGGQFSIEKYSNE
jgi:uncharacterized protein YbjT (DUF2867 family)